MGKLHGGRVLRLETNEYLIARSQIFLCLVGFAAVPRVIQDGGEDFVRCGKRRWIPFRVGRGESTRSSGLVRPDAICRVKEKTYGQESSGI